MQGSLKPIEAAVCLVESLLDKVITHGRHQLSNALAEGLSGKIMAV
jgi:hypothetical protein